MDRPNVIRLGRKVDWLMVLAFLLTAMAFILMIRTLPFRAVIFPCFIAAVIVINVVIYGIGKLRNPAVWDFGYDPENKQDTEVGPDFVLRNRTAVSQAFIAFFALSATTFLLGQIYALPLFVSGYLFYRGENKIFALSSGVILWALIQFVFAGFMSLNMPTGYLFSLFGL